MTSGPPASMHLAHAAWLSANITATRARLQFVIDAKGEVKSWPDELVHAEARIDALVTDAIAEGHSMPMRWLDTRLGLTPTEQRVLWVLIAHELCPVVRAQLRALNTESLADPTTATLRHAVYAAPMLARAWRELSADGALRRLALIERTDTDANAPEHRQTWRASSRVVALAHGDEQLDAEAAPFAARSQTNAVGIAAAGLEASPSDADAIDAAIRAVLANRHGLVIVQGQPGTGRRSQLASAARKQELDVLEIDATQLTKDGSKAKRQLRVLDRECRLLGLTPLLRGVDALQGSVESPDILGLVESELAGQIVMATSGRSIARRWRTPPRIIELAPLTGDQRARLWNRALPMVSAEDADMLANMYPLAPAVIDAAARVAIEQAGQSTMSPEHISAGLRAVLDDRLAGLATRVRVTQSWDDLVLPPDQVAVVIDLIARIRERRRVYETWGFAKKVGRGLGVSALFAGPPGTGKTMAAGLVARELGAELYQVDISKIVSKWLGETEKNLAALFDAAEAGHAILLFDEADTLFGKRTDVKTSNDRHANQETNFLLQRLESFSGVCILTTNHDTAIDEAFRRRLSAHIQFPMPEAEEREQLWRTLLPATAPTEGELDFDLLARKYEMSGGYIRNAVLRAAFMAADERTPIAARHLARGAQLEYQAMGRIASQLH